MVDSSESREQGLRARKKRQTESEIVSTAIRLFNAQGIRGTLLSQVASASRVSPATLFNYFPNKSSLAEAWVRGELEEALAAAGRDLSDHGLRSTMRSLCRRVAEGVSEQRQVRLEAWRAVGRAPIECLTAAHPIVAALRREQERERVRADISAQTLAEMMLDAIEGGVIAGLRTGQTEDELGKAAQTRVDLILDGARKKNERVAAPTTSRSRKAGV